MMGYGLGYGSGCGYGSLGGHGFGGVLMLLFGLLFIGGLVLLVVWAVRESHRHGRGAHGAVAQAPSAAGYDEAVAIAKRRLASGEITVEQYGEVMRTLGR